MLDFVMDTLGEDANGWINWRIQMNRCGPRGPIPGSADRRSADPRQSGWRGLRQMGRRLSERKIERHPSAHPSFDAPVACQSIDPPVRLSIILNRLTQNICLIPAQPTQE